MPILSQIYGKIESILGGRGLSRYKIIVITAYFIISKLKKSTAIVDGHIMYLDPPDSLRLSINGVYEKFETQTVKQYIKPGDVVLDLGANIGYYTLIFAKLVGKQGKVYAFEPDPNNFKLLQKNIEVNNYTNVELIQKAVSDKNGKATMYIVEEHPAGNRLFDAHDKADRNTIEVKTIRLDDFFNNDNHEINFIKMDVEGTENKVIAGMPLILRKTKKLKMMVEFAPTLIKESGIDPRQFFQPFLDNNFQIFHINKRKKQIQPTTIEKLVTKFTPEKGSHVNLLLVKNSS